jgi:hypothetical protein
MRRLGRFRRGGLQELGETNLGRTPRIEQRFEGRVVRGKRQDATVVEDHEEAVHAAKLDSFKNQQLLIGPTTFSATDHIPLDRPMVVIQYTDGKPQFLTRQAPGITIAVGDS